MKHLRAIETKTGADSQFPEGAERARWRPGNSYPDGEVEPFAPLDHFRISQQVLAPAGPRTDSRLERLSRPLPEETLFGNCSLGPQSLVSVAKEELMV